MRYTKRLAHIVATTHGTPITLTVRTRRIRSSSVVAIATMVRVLVHSISVVLMALPFRAIRSARCWLHFKYPLEAREQSNKPSLGTKERKMNNHITEKR